MKSLFNIFKKTKQDTDKEYVDDDTIMGDTKMSLEERINWRNGAASRSVIHIFETLGAVEDMFSFTIYQADVRGHDFNIAVGLHKHFKFSNKIKLTGFNALEHYIQQYAKNRYGIRILNIYWKSTGPFDLTTVWDEAFSGADDLTGKLYKYSDKVLEKADLPVSHSDTNFGEIGNDQVESFRRAIEHGGKIPTVQINNKDYDTDFSPYN